MLYLSTPPQLCGRDHWEQHAGRGAFAARGAHYLRLHPAQRAGPCGGCAGPQPPFSQPAPVVAPTCRTPQASCRQSSWQCPPTPRGPRELPQCRTPLGQNEGPQGRRCEGGQTRGASCFFGGVAGCVDQAEGATQGRPCHGGRATTGRRGRQHPPQRRNRRVPLHPACVPPPCDRCVGHGQRARVVGRRPRQHGCPDGTWWSNSRPCSCIRAAVAAACGGPAGWQHGAHVSDMGPSLCPHCGDVAWCEPCFCC